MEDIFTGDIFEKIEPPHDISFKIIGTVLPTNQDIYFVAKWHEIFERYTSARLFVRKALEEIIGITGSIELRMKRYSVQ